MNISLSAQQAAVPLPKPQDHVIQPDQRKIRETPLELMIKHVLLTAITKLKKQTELSPKVLVQLKEGPRLAPAGHM